MLTVGKCCVKGNKVWKERDVYRVLGFGEEHRDRWEEIYCTAFNRMMNYICGAFLSCKVVLLGKCTQETVVWHMDVHSYRDWNLEKEMKERCFCCKTVYLVGDSFTVVCFCNFSCQFGIWKMLITINWLMSLFLECYLQLFLRKNLWPNCASSWLKYNNDLY